MTLHIHFAGSFASGFRFGLPDTFNTDLIFYGYDRDEEAAREGWGPTDARERFFGVLLSDAEKTVQFNKNVDVYTSSYLNTNRSWPDLYHASPFTDGDYLLSEAGATDVVLPLATTTLDLIAERHDAPVDALIMDTQGAELDILKGGASQLRGKTLAVYTEIGMGPLYENQPMFWDIAAWLHKAGFIHAGIFPQEWSPYRNRIGWRGKAFQWSGDALFLKDIDHVLAHHADPQSDLRKLALLAVTCGYLEYAVEALRRAAALSTADNPPSKATEQVYDRFLDEFMRLESLATEPFPIDSVDIRGCDIAARRKRYVEDGKSQGLSKVIQRLIRSEPDALILLLQRYGFHHVTPVVESATHRDIIITLRALGYNANEITEEVLNALETSRPR
jgi:FkbM family methyltransferase